MLPITSVFASLAVFFYIALAVRVVTLRRSKRVSLGVADTHALETRVRQHGNFSEYAPLTLLLMAFAELQGAPSALIALAGIALLIGRLTHALGLENMKKPIGLKLRTYGMLITFFTLIVLAITLLSLALF